MDCTCEVGLGAAGFVARAAEGPWGAGVTVLRLWAATPQTPHFAVCPVHHLYELSHPVDEGEGGREGRRKGRNEHKEEEDREKTQVVIKQGKIKRRKEETGRRECEA